MELIISSKDYNTLNSLLGQQSTQFTYQEARQLSEELKKMKVMASDVMPVETIGINSEVSILDVKSGNTMQFKITLPSLANMKEKRVSIFAPISIALLGFKKGDLIEWQMPGGIKQLKVKKVVNITDQ